VYRETEYLINKLPISRNQYINEAVAFYNRLQMRRLLEEQLVKESQIVSDDFMEILAEFEK